MIKEFIKNIAKNEVLKGGVILLILINIGNVFSYLFHFSMARLLGPADYGVLAVLTNLIYFFNIPEVSIRTVVSKYTTKFKIKKEYGKIKGIFYYLTKKLTGIALILFGIFIIISKLFLAEMLNIPFWLLVLSSMFLFGALIYPIGYGILQGMKKFKVWGWNFVLNCAIKLAVGVLLVLMGFRVYGAILGFIFGIFISFLFIFPFIKEIMKSKEIKEKPIILSKENLSPFLAMLFIVFFYSIDVFLANRFFSPDITGKYAVASMIGKIIFFGTMAIGNAMFPISSENFICGGKNKTRGLIKKTFIAILGLCIIAILVLVLVPKLIVWILFGTQYLSISNILAYVGAAFSFISLLNVLILYRISIDEFKAHHLFFLIFFLIVQLYLLGSFHRTIEEFSIIFLITNIIIFAGSFIFIRKWKN